MENLPFPVKNMPSLFTQFVRCLSLFYQHNGKDPVLATSEISLRGSCLEVHVMKAKLTNGGSSQTSISYLIPSVPPWKGLLMDRHRTLKASSSPHEVGNVPSDCGPGLLGEWEDTEGRTGWALGGKDRAVRM